MRKEARKIADLLGSLPLALVHAGAFLRLRHRTLGEYHQHYMTRRNDLLRFPTRLGDTDQAILTAWEINFKQVEQDSPAATYHLLPFSFLDQSSIPEMILPRGSSSQKRWASDENEGVDECLTEVIQGNFIFDNAVEKLLSFSLVSCNKESNRLRNFSIHPLV